MNDVRPSDLRSLERRVTAWMADEAAPVAHPSELEQILTETSRLRPEPRWLVLLKEPPMRISGSRVAVGEIQRRRGSGSGTTSRHVCGGSAEVVW